MEIARLESNVFSVRIVSIDYYMAPPVPDLDISYSSFQGGNVNEVPVIRVYGPTPGGQKTCLHIHRVLPYLYVPCEEMLFQPQQEGVAFANDLSLALEKALKLKCNANSKQRQHVHSVDLVRARKFYGYHSSEELFVKVRLYYPHDVSRAATFLLNGAVLDKSLQPHESHIPFLLQFLVDYNLYGMSHLHLSKMKFRHPVPDVCSKRRSKHFYIHEKEMDNSTCMSSGYKADPNIDPNHLPIWISSTIPVDWMGLSPSPLNASADQGFSLCKRQSVCELEGDAAVDDILNQQFKMYTTLSQTGSNVKMVQSLVSIWEEEYRRVGTQEVPISPDPGKPLPEEVLKTFSLGLDYQQKMNELFGKSEGLSFLASSVEEEKAVLLSKTHLFDEKKSFVPGEFYLDNVGMEAFNVDEEIKASGSQLCGSLSEEFRKSSAIGCEISQKVISTDEVQVSPKIPDEEAHNLLRWLASSQAAQDINSDDELICETILSPLLPAATIEKVVEKANMDYESESQKECQDILDSIDDFIEFKGSTEKSSKILLEKLIPQVDGSGDDLFPFPCNDVTESPADDGSGDDLSSPPCDDAAGNSPLSEVDKRKYERCSGSNLLQGIEERLSSYKTDVSVWGSMPLLSREEAQKDVYAPLDSANAFVHGNVYSRGEMICSAKEENHKDSSTKKYVYDSADTSVLAKCSLRDMMRRKRVYRTEAHEVGSHKVKRALQGEKPEVTEKKLGMMLHDCFHISKTFTDQQVLNQNLDAKPPILFDSVKSLEVGSINDSKKFDEKVSEGAGSKSKNSIVTAPPLFTEILESSVTETHFADFDCSQSCTSYVNTRDSKGIPPANIGDPNDNLKIENFGNKQAKEPLVLSGVGSSVNMAIKENGLPGFTFCKKPPSADVVNECLSEISNMPSFPDSKLVDRASGRAIDDLPPFFLREERDVFDGPCDFSSHQEAPIGVPTHYQNDGSLLYLLTPVQAPPAANEVLRWLSFNHRVSSEEFASEIPLANDCDMSPHQSCSLSQTRTIGNLVSQENPGKLQVDKEVSAKNVAMIMESGGESLQLSAYSNSSQDISQISAPFVNEKSTPLSQIGFRDPASVGGGQQLTLLSIEVLAESRGDLNPNPLYDAVNVVVLVFQNDSDSVVDILMLLRNQKDSQKSGPKAPTAWGRRKYSHRHVCDKLNRNKLRLLQMFKRHERRFIKSLPPIIHSYNFLQERGTSQSPDGISNCKMLVFSDERNLFLNFIDIICSVDPDIIMGWDVQGCSLGFLAERASQFGIGLLKKISRAPLEFNILDGDLESPREEISGNLISESLAGVTALHDNSIIGDEWGRTHASGVHVGGRIVLNVWRLMRSEVKLHIYTLEAVSEAVLKQKIPLINHKVLTKWFASGSGRARYQSLEYLMRKAKLNLEIMNQLDMINRTSELARVFGIDFFSVLSRGSQYRVESMLLRLAHTQNYIAVSPGNQQVASQPAMECLPLVMEPESAFYADPVVVLDFQSLYPSMIIAYNLCFCTCLGKVTPSKEDTLGVISYSPHPEILQGLIDQILLTPNGVMYVAPKVCKGILPRLLEEILSTRIMVKKAMKKLSPSEKVLYRIFDSRQLALKLIANVTYGYTAAGFSGRMPCAELADSIVQCGRATLEKAISVVNSHDKWKAKVIYGDTDSMFVLLKGRTVKEAFLIGQEIVEEITAMNPKPVTLKLEKVYHPCFLLTKKRYVGFSYESPDQVEPIFDAKGIETVRRDTCGAVAKTMEQSLRLFFEHQSAFEVKGYLLRQWNRILSGKVSLQDFVFAKEVRLGTYSTKTSSSLPPAAIVATKAMRADPRAEPRYGDRIPYVVVHGIPGARLVDMVVNPLELLAVDSQYRLNDLYYINKQIIPALQRVFGLVGANLNQWFQEMPRPVREGFGKRPSLTKDPKRTRIDSYYLSRHCLVCGELVHASSGLCNHCSGKGSAAPIVLTRRASIAESEMQHLTAICQHCGGGDPLMENGVKCVSLACSVFYERRKVQKELGGLVASAADKGFYPNCKIEWF